MSCIDSQTSLQNSPNLQDREQTSGTQPHWDELQILKFAAKTIGQHIALTLDVNLAQHRFLLRICMRTNYPLTLAATTTISIATTSKSVRELWLQHVSA